MLDFKLEISKSELFPNEKARIKFILSNKSGEVVHCLSYKFTSYWQDKTVDDFQPHEFFFNLKPNETKDMEFGETDISGSYLAGNKAGGIYEIKVEIKYFICGKEEISQVSNNVYFVLKDAKQYVEN